MDGDSQQTPETPALPAATLTRGLEARVDLRLATVAAMLTAGSSPVEGEHALVTSTREELSFYADHPSVRWLTETVERTWFLSVAMQTAQLGAPPLFIAPPLEDIPFFVLRDFADPAAQDLAPHLSSFWREARLGTLLERQAPLWAEGVAEIATILDGLDIVGFQERFFGRFPYHAVVVPLLNLVPSWVNGVGVANTRETYAVCCRATGNASQPYASWVTELAQHEASHPVLELILQEHPGVPADCAFIEAAYPPTTRFASVYDTAEARWTETFIRASTWFFLMELGREQEASEHLRRHASQSAPMIEPFVKALTPWWQRRRMERAPGVDVVLDQFPTWLHAVI